MNIIALNNISFKYFENEVLKGLDFSIKKDLTYAIIGENGSGKSTLAKLITNVLEVDRGNIEIFDDKKVGLVFQNPDNQFVTFKVMYDLAFGLENQRLEPEAIEAKIYEISEKLKITDLLDKNIDELSGGQKQRVAIASMLCMGFDIIILDEATSMLDPISKKDFLTYLNEYKAAHNITIISITHDLNEASYADQVLYLSNGQVKLSGTPSEVFNHPDVDEYMKPEYARLSSAVTKEEFEEFLWQLK